tara:strand:+ start:2613 stop:5792 length:3180 start_codon:yes stop_codon:yes gene_type:complete
MPYNPIERPMPFDQILQAGLMKQQSLDRTLAAVDEFSEQKMLMGGARTLDAAKDLNKKYIGKASDLTNQIMTGAITPEQAGFELRNINKDYNKSNAVKQVLADQGLANLSNQTSVNQRLLANRAENPNWNYETGAFRQENVDDLESGKATIDARGYGVMEDPGLYEDFAAELGQIHEQYIKESGVTNFYYDQNTGQYKETATNNVIEISEERVKDLINDYVYRGDISETDKQSVLYRMARRKRLDPDNPYDEEDLANDLYQAASFIPYRSTQTTTDMGVSGRGRGGSSSKTDTPPTPTVQLEVQAERSSLQDQRNLIYDINENAPASGIKAMLKDENTRLEAAGKKLGRSGYKLKEGSTVENPEFVYAKTGEPVIPSDPAERKKNRWKADFNAAKRELDEYKSDMILYESLLEGVDEKVKRNTGKTFNELVDEVETEYKPEIEKLGIALNSPSGSRPEGFFESLSSLLPWDDEARTGGDISRFVEDQELLKSTIDGIYGKENSVGITKGMGVFIQSDLLFPNTPENQIADKVLEKIAESKYSDGSPIEIPEDAVNMLRTNPEFVQLSFAQYIDPRLKTVVDTQINPTIALGLLKNKNYSAYQTYVDAQKDMADTLKENNLYKMGRALNTQEGKEGNPTDRAAQFYVRGNPDLVLRDSEGKAGSEEKGGELLQDVYEKTGARPDDFQLTVAFMDEGPNGSTQYYGKMIYNPAKADKEIADAVAEAKFNDFDVNITDIAEDLFPGNIELIYQASSMMKDHVYTLDVNQSRDIFIPSNYGPSTKVKVTKSNEGIHLDGFVFGEDANGNITKVSAMDLYYQNNPGIPEGYPMPIDAAAEYAAQVAISAAGVKHKHPNMFDENGVFMGAPVPKEIVDRKKEAREAISSSVSKIKEKFSDVYEDSDSETIDELMQIIDFETASSFHPNQRNANQGPGTAVGLIQFYKDKGNELVKTIGGKKFTFAELGRMSIPEQVEKAMVPYLNENGGKVKSIDDLYFAVFMPVFAGMDQKLTLQEAYDLGVERIGEERMKNLDPKTLRESNKAFKQARTLEDIIKKVRSHNKS